MKNHIRARILLACLLLLPGLGALALAQAPQSPPPATPPPAGNEDGFLGAPTPDTGDIDEILEGEEEVLSGSGGFTYDPGNRRDPFKSLLTGPEKAEQHGPRPEGIPGLLIDEIQLLGIWRTPRGYVAQIRASNKSFLLREGDQLFDGDVVTIQKNEVVFKQQVQDPTALKPFREVVKNLSPAR
ncbi:MAG: hypothetical protein QOH06_4823 [Acidobacteriota bacterium]|jgi:hypothetical protein|nr:hypothetical protein [Acidobacteriota bacterium]